MSIIDWVAFLSVCLVFGGLFFTALGVLLLFRQHEDAGFKFAKIGMSIVLVGYTALVAFKVLPSLYAQMQRESMKGTP